MADSMERRSGSAKLRWVVDALWWLLFLLIALLVSRRPLPPADGQSSQRALPPAGETAAERSHPPGAGFPAPVTLVAGAWLLLSTLSTLIALVVVIASPVWLVEFLGASAEGQIDDLLVTTLAGCVGGSVSAIVAYLKHACEKADFRVAFLPWYFARPLLGLLLGLVAYFLVKGGLLITIPSAQGADINDFGLAAIGSLVGLFSKNALEKLREVFHVVFASKDDMRRKLETDGERPAPGASTLAGDAQ